MTWLTCQPKLFRIPCLAWALKTLIIGTEGRSSYDSFSDMVWFLYAIAPCEVLGYRLCGPPLRACRALTSNQLTDSLANGLPVTSISLIVVH
jgi:hypothetical protein